MAMLCRQINKLLPRYVLTRTYSDYGVRLRILPTTCFFDEPVQVKLTGLAPQQQVELRSKHKDDNNVVFKATAIYQADKKGEVDLSRHSSLGGTYTGVEPMGLFWSMRPDIPHKNLTARDASKAILVEIEASSGDEILAKETHQRRFLAEGVRRILVRESRLFGTLFVPPGEGPFPAIIVLGPLGGHPSEPQSALLANRKFVVLSLSLYGYQDASKKIERLDLEYFEEAIKFLQMQPEVKQTGVGIMSISKSGDVALSMAAFLDHVKATVCINGCIANILFPLHYKDIVIPALTGNNEKIVITKSGIIDIRDAVKDPMAKENLATVIPIERASCKFLFLVSEDDRNWDSAYYAELACSKLKAHGKTDYEVVSYPKSGHFLQVPYMPHYPSGFHAAVKQVTAFGGEAKPHADAQVDAWGRILNFFEKTLK
ncbi:acyl-coenzyme A thioesterase 1 [Brachyhypopomus gauderio]|uniref:acyl-coenzyme A thioesterase 1 n=1 Tax=Brachyhypopomus gauderio TaxID=698409 RepID=UPI0040423C60